MIKRLCTSFVDSCDLNDVVMIDLFASDLLNAYVWIKSQLYSLKLAFKLHVICHPLSQPYQLVCYMYM